MLRKSKNLKTSKIVLLGGLLVTTVLYFVSIEWPLLILSAICMAYFLPMPKSLNSWFSRFVTSTLFILALLQIAAAIQYIIHPAGGFKLLAFIFATAVGLLCWPFLKSKRTELKLFSRRDIYALITCLFFLVPFALYIRQAPTLKLTEMAGTQVVDSIAHYADISDTYVSQSLNYNNGHYYPKGFHISVSFVEHSLTKNINSYSWRAHLFIYFLLYLLFGILLCLSLIYLCFALIDGFYETSPERVPMFMAAISVGISVSVLYLFTFINEGFLNYFYVSAAAIFSAIFLLGERNNSRADNKNDSQSDWWLIAYLTIAMGVSFSWPLLTPVVILIAVLWKSNNWRQLIEFSKPSVLIIYALVLLHFLALIFQVEYMKNNSEALNASGALHSFDLALLLIGALVVLFAVLDNKITGQLKQFLAALFVPYIFLIGGLMLSQFFQYGEAKYYLIKTSELLNMLFIAVITAYAASKLAYTELNLLLNSVLVFGFVMFLILTTTGLSSRPLQETRELFRDYSGIGKPPYLESDSQAMVQLGTNNKLHNFNMVALHYDQAGDRLYSQIETALWADTMATSQNNVPVFNDDSRARLCFGKVFPILAYGVSTQTELIHDVIQCSQIAANLNQPYFIVTDPASVKQLRLLFGNDVTLVY